MTVRELFWVLLCTALLLIGRRPGAFYHPQFYAEDGHVWYAQAYNLGLLHSFVLPDAGYINTLPRLGASLALLAPFRWAPLVTVVFGLLVQLLPIVVLLSPRARTWGRLSTRAIFALIYALSPNAGEIHVVLTNTQWHLSLVAILLAFCEPPKTVVAAVCDLVCFFVLGLSGPFSILLLPVLLLYWYLKRQPWTAVLASVTAVCAFVEARVIMQSQTVRHMGELGASVSGLVRIVGGNIVSDSFVGSHGTNRLHGIWNHFAHPGTVLSGDSLIWPTLVMSAGLLVLAYVVLRGPLPLRLLILYALLMLAASLHSPLISGPKPLWQLLAENTNGRYWFTPMIALLWGTVWCARQASARLVQRTAMALLLCLPLGMLLDYHYRAATNFDFPLEYEMVRSATPGTRVSFPIPPGGTWDVTLEKRGPTGTVEVH